MGLLRWLFGDSQDKNKATKANSNINQGASKPKEKAPESPSKKPSSRKPANRAQHDPSHKSLILEGDCERTVYTYDGAPLKGTRKGSVFYADVVTRRVKLTSTLNGAVWDTGQNGGVALALNGKVFGTTNTLDKTFRKLVDRGYSIKVKVKRLGMYDVGTPEVVMMIPDPDEIMAWVDACEELGREIPFDERNCQECLDASDAYDERKRLEWAVGHELPRGVEGISLNFDEWTGPMAIDDASTLNVSTSWIPTPKGSSAKPHILIKEGDISIIELSARNGNYSFLAEHVGERPFECVCRKLDSMRDEGGYYWKLTLVYFTSNSD